MRDYVEARAANAARATSFAPPRAEEATFSYRVGLASAPDTPVVLNEFMAANTRTLADPQGDYDDRIELRNLTDAPVDLGGWYLTDNPNNPRQWACPPGTIIPPAGYLLVWADEDVDAPFGLHAAFKLSANGEAIDLLDTDANFNIVRDRVVFDPQAADQALGRPAANPDLWTVLPPSPGLPNP